jgi:hypothetical protein|tara:strand:+ start:2931 stop:3212 length:282 start_codon:yes stop_codon:yes gene_type:complete
VLPLTQACREAGGQCSSSSSPPPTTKKDIIKIKDPEMKFWDSSRESKIEVKLVSVEDKNIFVLVTSGRKTLRVTGAQLSLASLNEAEKLGGLE